MKCPRCVEALRAERAAGGELMLCPGCAGVLFPPDELRRWIREETSPGVVLDSLVAVPSTSEVPQASCPRCDILMDRLRRDAIDMTVDVCPRCRALWFDEPELEKADRAKETTPNAFERAAHRLLGVVEALRHWYGFEAGGRIRMHRKFTQAVLTLERADLLRADEARELIDSLEAPVGGEEALRGVELEGYVEVLYRARLLSPQQYEDKMAVLRARREA